MDLLTKLARAFDTKGYPDDKNPDHWKTINHAPAHIDKNGNIDGGAGGKFNNKAWTSTKNPHKPESYPKDPLEILAETTKPGKQEEKPVTSEDLEEAWKKVVKYKVAMNQSKSQKTYEKHSQNLMNAIGNYNDLAQKASPDVAKKKHNVSNMEAHAQKPWNELHKNQPQQDPLSSLAEATAPEPEATSVAPTNPNAPNGAYTPDPAKAKDVTVSQFIQKLKTVNGYVGISGVLGLESDQIDNLKSVIDKYVNATNYDKFTLEEKKQIWKAFSGKSNYIDIVKQAQDIIGGQNGANKPTSNNVLETLASATAKQGMEAFPNGLESAGMTKKFKEVSMATIKAAQNKSHGASNITYQKLGAESGKVWKKATKLQKKCAYEYTKSYSKYNEPLRGKEYYGSEKGVGNVDFDNVYDNPNQRQKTDALTALIHKTSLGEARMVYRGVGIEGMDKAFNVPSHLLSSGNEKALKNALEGLEWTDHGFGSVGADKGDGFTCQQIQMEIYAPKGTKGIYAEPFSKYGQDYGESWNGNLNTWHQPGSENEIILQRGTRYKIMDVKKVGGKIKLVMQIVSQDPYKLP